ncbi:MAG: hypothetical protein LBB21_03270 [Holosporaceae bacterium]|nr:hypothetical protein [Holosporaceae bacterium]
MNFNKAKFLANVRTVHTKLNKISNYSDRNSRSSILRIYWSKICTTIVKNEQILTFLNMIVGIKHDQKKIYLQLRNDVECLDTFGGKR